MTWKHPTIIQLHPHSCISFAERKNARGEVRLESRKQLKRQTPLAGPVHRRKKKMDELVKADLAFDW